MIQALGSLLIAFILFPVWAEACREVSRTVYLMGTSATLTACTSGRAAGLADLESYLRILEETEQDLSTWREDSDISRFNRHPIGLEFQVSPMLSRMFSNLRLWHDRTGGTFDASVGALTAAWGIHTGGHLPSVAELEAARARSGMKHLRLDSRTHRLTRTKGLTIDVGGFGKGEGLDRVAESAGVHESPAFMIDLGGQVLVRSSNQRPFWAVDIAHPMYRDDPVTSIRLRSGSLSTSGGSEHDLSVDGIRIGHIIDPRSGQPVVSNVSVSVWHEHALTADILSTALYVMGIEAGLRWAGQNKIAAVFLLPSVSKKIELRTTESWNLLLSDR